MFIQALAWNVTSIVFCLSSCHGTQVQGEETDLTFSKSEGHRGSTSSRPDFSWVSDGHLHTSRPLHIRELGSNSDPKRRCNLITSQQGKDWTYKSIPWPQAVVLTFAGAPTTIPA